MSLNDPKWQPAIDAARNDTASLLYPWTVLRGVSQDRFAAERDSLIKRLKDQTLRANREEAEIEWLPAVSWKAVSAPSWSISGPAFKALDVKQTDLDVRITSDSEPRVLNVFSSAIADSGLLSDKLTGTVQSRTFTIDKPHMLYRMAGHGARLRMVIDGLLQLRDPLYGGLVIEPDAENMKWYVQDVSRWIGHKAYVELQDVDNGYLALDRVGQSAGGPPTDAPNPIITEMLSQPRLASASILDSVYKKAIWTQVTGRDAGQQYGQQYRDEIIAWAARWAPLTAGTSKSLAELVKRRTALEQNISIPAPALAAADGTGENERVHLRGNYRSPGTDAPRRFLEACDGPTTFASESGSGRLVLAEHITAPTDPLFARVMVNRMWQHLFGDGIVRTPDDFGVMGQRPTNPELLDWLAGEFVRENWSIKRMLRLMALSSTYRMESRVDAKSDAADPQNVLLHRMPIRRMEAECIRDSILTVSGQAGSNGLRSAGYAATSMHSHRGRGAPSSGPVDGAGQAQYLHQRAPRISYSDACGV